jgi:uncharacterized membrane protein
MEFFNSLYILIAMTLTIIVLDYVWLGIITKNFIISQFGSLVKVENGSIVVKLGVGLLAWTIIAIGCFIFVVNPYDSFSKVLLFGAIFGFISYSIYDLTNLTFITNYPVKFVFVDIAWGTVVCATVSAVGFYVKTLLS